MVGSSRHWANAASFPGARRLPAWRRVGETSGLSNRRSTPQTKKTIKLKRTSAQCVDVEVSQLPPGQRVTVKVAALREPKALTMVDQIHLGMALSSAPMIGYALDGFPIHALAAAGLTEPTDLDDCRGHTDTARGYHYHVSGPGKNQIIGCFAGETARSEGGDRRGPPGGARGAQQQPEPGAQQPARDGPGAQAPSSCTAEQATKCCGDKVCDGPETESNCPADCLTK